jgi:cytoskeletal protein RodZ
MRIWPFNRSKELNDYYSPPETTNDNLPGLQDEEEVVEWREHAGVAWLLAFTTLMATILIAFGLFFGGRLAYRKIAGTNDKNKPETQQVTNEDQTKQPVQTNSSDNKAPSPSPATPAPSTTQPTTQPAVAGKLVNTGPGNTIAIFLATTIVATLLHAGYTRRKLASN